MDKEFKEKRDFIGKFAHRLTSIFIGCESRIFLFASARLGTFVFVLVSASAACMNVVVCMALHHFATVQHMRYTQTPTIQTHTS